MLTLRELFERGKPLNARQATFYLTNRSIPLEAGGQTICVSTEDGTFEGKFELQEVLDWHQDWGRVTHHRHRYKSGDMHFFFVVRDATGVVDTAKIEDDNYEVFFETGSECFAFPRASIGI